ncbi:HWE histidine kinase domain-containing protein, partial [Roseomonas sp. GCM10028921]
MADPVPHGADAVRMAALEVENMALRAEAARSRQLLESATDYAIITLGTEGRVTSWSAGARRLLGYAEEEILGRSGELFFMPEDRVGGAFRSELWQALDQGRASNERWHLRKDGSRFWASGVMSPLLDGGGRPKGFLNILRDGTESRAEVERRALVEAELLHRVRNTLTLAQAVAVQTLRHAETPEAFKVAFTSRLRALARSHEMLAQGGRDGAPLAKVLERALAPYEGPPGRVVLEGSPVRLASAAVVKLSLAFHELASNAAKYGALSAPGGG